MLIDSELFEHWLDNLDSSTQESFFAFAEDTFSVVEIFLYARFLGYSGAISCCNNWINEHYTKPDHRKKLLFERVFLKKITFFFVGNINVTIFV